MRSVFAAVAIGLISVGQAAASSIMVAEDASPPITEQAVPAEAVVSKGSSSIVYLGEPSTTPKPSSPAAKQVDGTETASVGGVSEQNRIETAWNQAEADAAWAKTSSVASPSIIYMGSPEPVAAKTSAKVATSSNQMPMVMRAGIAGGAAPSKAPSAPPTAATASPNAAPGAPKNLQEARERAMR